MAEVLTNIKEINYKETFNNIQNDIVKNEYSEVVSQKIKTTTTTTKKYIVDKTEQLVAPGTIWEDMLGSVSVIQTFASNTLNSVRGYFRG